MFGSMIHKYAIGEIVFIKDNVRTNQRKARILISDDQQIKVRFLDNNEETSFQPSSLQHRVSLPILKMMDMAENLMSMWMFSDAFDMGQEKRNSMLTAVTVLDCMIGKVSKDNMHLFGYDESQGICVVMEEEFGYKQHLWFPRMSESELISWWEKEEDMGKYYLNPVNTLPGKVLTMNSTQDMMCWRALRYSQEMCFVHIFDNCDSYLKSSDGEVHKHKGHKEDDCSRPGDVVLFNNKDGKLQRGYYDDDMTVIQDEEDKK